jgi:hypothetical protein
MAQYMRQSNAGQPERKIQINGKPKLKKRKKQGQRQID